MTAAERSLWVKLRGHRFNGHRFHRQTSIENYVVDFYCAEKRLVLEIDGSIHFLFGKSESDLRRQTISKNWVSRSYVSPMKR